MEKIPEPITAIEFKKIIDELKLTQYYVAKKAEVTYPTLNQWITGKRNIGMDAYIKVVGVVNIEIKNG